ncbi:hypothetical protein ABZP36_033889 [Zizania latifolia]
MEAADWMLGREEQLVAELCHLLPPSPTTTRSCGSTAPGLSLTTAASGRGGRQRGSRKRVRDNVKLLQAADDDLHDAATNAKHLRCSKTSRKRQQTTSTVWVTTVPDFDGYQWRKYGQKQIEGAQYTRSYYRCTNSTDQGCLAKRTVQRNDDDGGADVEGGGGSAAWYTVTYISEHTCKSIESAAAPVILETTTVRANHELQPPAAEHDHAAVVAAAGSCASTGSMATSSSSSDIITAWSSTSGADPSSYHRNEQHDDFRQHLLAGDGDYWDMYRQYSHTTTQAAISAVGLFEEMALTGPIRSPVHIAANSWMDDLLLNGLFVSSLAASDIQM